MQKTKRFGKDFILVIIGQIISLFGNAVLRFALPLYLFDQTGSPTLLGLVSAGSFLPMVVLSPVGGIVADRVNKRNIMVVLDFSAAALIALFALALGRMFCFCCTAFRAHTSLRYRPAFRFWLRRSS